MPIPEIKVLPKATIPPPENTMRIRMLSRARGAPDGYTINLYEADTEYDVPDRLGQPWVNNGTAELVGAVEPTNEPSEEEVAAAAAAEAEAEAESEIAGRGVHWALTTPPDRYLERYGDEAPQSDLAHWVLGHDGYEKPE